MRETTQMMEYRLATLGGVVAAVSAALVLFGGDAAGTVAIAPLVLTMPVGGGLLAVGLWIVGGAVLFGAIGWGAVTLALPTLSPVVGLGIGVALGGGFGAVVRLLVIEDTTDTIETVSVDTSSDDVAATPEPADLFETHPDSILYYATTGDGPVVRAANDAFVETFDVAETMVDGAPLRDALMFQDTDDIVTAVEKGTQYDAVHVCDTTDGDESFRVRLAATEASGYVLYTEQSD